MFSQSNNIINIEFICIWYLPLCIQNKPLSIVCLLQLDNQGSAYHECNVVFFMPGLYKVDIHCFSQGKSRSVELCTDISSDVTPAHTWKLIPPIEITVMDP